MSNNYPVSFQQRQFLWLHNLDKQSSAYNIPVLFTIEGDLDIEILKQAFTALVDSNKILDAIFSIENGHYYIKDGCITKVENFAVAELPDDGSDSILNEILTFISKPFELKKGPLCRSLLIKKEANSFIWCLVMHHSICDLRTKELICEIMGKNYAKLVSAGGSYGAVEMQTGIDYKSYALMQNEWILSDAARKMKEFWKNAIKEFPDSISLPFDFQRPACLKLDGTVMPVSFSENVSLKIKDFSKKNGVTPFLCLFTAYAVLMSRYSGQEKIIIGVPFTNRRDAKFQETLGCFVNTLPITIDLSNNKSILESMKDIRQMMLYAHRNQELPTELIIREMPKTGNIIDKNPLYQIGFTFEPMCDLNIDGCEIKQHYIHHGGSQLDLFATFWTEENTFQGVFEYNDSLFTNDTVTRWSKNFQYLVECFINNPEQCIQSISIIDHEELELLEQFSKPQVKITGSRMTFLELLFKNIEKHPSKTAVIFEDRKISYHNLNLSTYCVSQFLIKKGAKKNQVIGLLVDRSEDMLITLIGILRSGAAYLPLDPEFPVERNNLIIKDSNVKLVITEKKYKNHFSDCECEIFYINEILSEPIQEPKNDELISEDSSAYLIYTSGSTGKPKGIFITHQNLNNFVNSIIHEPGISIDDKMLAVTTISFDIHVLELLVTLAAGATVVIAPKKSQNDAAELMKLIKDNNVTIMQATPVTWKLLIASGWSGKKDNFKILCGGEAMSKELSVLLLQRCSILYNMYGPTETTVWSTCHRVTGEEKKIPIGKPMENTRVVIIDKYGNLAPVGTWGELLIGGKGVTLGYHNREQLTKNKFPELNLTSEGSVRYYKTGDICRLTNDGLLEYAGREDNQIKMRGYRIELEEIEFIIETFPNVLHAAVITHGQIESEILVAYIVMSQECKMEIEPVKQYLLSKIPEYMVPARFIQIPSLPMTPNRKIDRNLLKTNSVIPSSEILKKVNMVCSNEMEKKIVDIWAGILQLEIEDLNTNFFDAGGNSLLMLKMKEILDSTMFTEIQMSVLLQYPTIKTLSQYLISNKQAITFQETQTRISKQKNALKKLGKRS